MTPKRRRLLQLLCAAAVLTMSALLVYHALALHAAGSLTREAVVARAAGLALPGAAALLLLAAGCLLAPARPVRTKGAEPAPEPARPVPVRLLLLAAAVLFIVLGVLNGGLWDVLVKAINICTECIGLG